MSDFFSRLMKGPMRLDRMLAAAVPSHQDPATGEPDLSGTYGMGQFDQPGDFQPPPNPPMEPSAMEEIMAAGELMKRGMVEEAQQLFERAKWRMQRTMERPGVQDAMQQGEQMLDRGMGMAGDAYGGAMDWMKGQRR